MSAVPSSPLKESSRTAESNLKAAHSHYIAGKELRSVLVPEDKFWHLGKTPSAEFDDANTTRTTRAGKATAHAQNRMAESEVDKQRQKLQKIRTEAQSYIPIAKILNVLCMAQTMAHVPEAFKDGKLNASLGPGPDTLVCLLNPTPSLLGDTFDTKVQPDAIVILTDCETAGQYLEKLELCSDDDKPPKLGDLRPAHVRVVAVVELKRDQEKRGNDEKGVGQLSNYLDTNKRYRPDLDCIYGLYGCKTGFAIYQLNPCQMTQLHCDSMDEETGLIPWRNDKVFSILQTFISTIYALSMSNNHPLSLEPDTLQVWKFDPNSLTPSQNRKETSEILRIVPFYAAHAPGRMTWVAASFEGGNQSTHRIVKFYWVDEEARWNEGELYQRAHGRSEGKHCWLGGLARVDNYWDFNRRLQAVPPNEDENSSLRRKLVGLRLGSSGMPLSQLKTDVDVLKCMYDLLESS